MSNDRDGHDAPALLPPATPLARRLAALTALLVLGGLGLLLWLRLREASAEQARLEAARVESAAHADDAASLEVVRPVETTYTPTVVLQGTLEPVQAADVGFEVPGRIARVDVELGQHVETGQALASLDRASVGAQTAQTDAAIAVAQANVDMLRDRVALLETLTQSGAAPERELTMARQQLAVAEAQLGQARASLRSVQTVSADHVLRAPFAGVVTRVPHGVGAVAGPGVGLVRIEDLGSLRLRTTVSESELEALALGSTAALDGHGGATGTIRSLVRSLDPNTRRAPVEALFSNADGRLIANALERARVVVDRPRPALRLPSTTRRPNGTLLVIGAGNRVEARPVEAQTDLDGSWLVTAGLTLEDRVVLRPATAREGAVVMPLEGARTDTSVPQAVAAP